MAELAQEFFGLDAPARKGGPTSGFSGPEEDPGIRSEAGPAVDADRVARTAARHAALAARVLPLPNLTLRAGVSLLLLDGPSDSC